MNSNQFREYGRAMVDYIANYMDTVADRDVLPKVEPGYLRNLLPEDAPETPESWDDIMRDVETKIMPGVTHWQHPNFHAYFPSGNSYPSILGDMLSDGLGVIGFSWASSPACTELETIVLDWLGKMIGLPTEFLSSAKDSKGGGVMQGSASECVLVTLLAARADKIRQLTETEDDESKLLSKLVAYCSSEAHSCMEKAAMVSFVKIRVLEPDQKRSLRGETLRQAMENDVSDGLIPFYVEATLGTTGCCSFDNLEEIGEVCEEYGAWLHVDGAYGGNSFICPELRGPMKGIERVQSFNLNPNKFLLTNFDCSVLWVRNKFRFTKGLVVDPLYLQHSQSENSIDYRHWSLSLSRRFRSLKLWFVLRCYGIQGLQDYIRNHCKLAKYFASLVTQDNRFELVAVNLGLVCFRLRGSDSLNQEFLSSINESNKLHMIPATYGEKYMIRFCVCAEKSTVKDIDYAWNVISEQASSMRNTIDKDLMENIVKRHSLISNDLLNPKTKLMMHKKLQRMISDPEVSNPTVQSHGVRRGSLDLQPSILMNHLKNWESPKVYLRSMSHSDV